MQDQELDPQQCQQLRQNEKEIDKQMDILVDKEAQARNQLDKLRSELSDVLDELKDLEIIRAAAAMASGGRSLVASGSGLLAGDISDRISVAKSKIQKLNVAIGFKESEIERFQENINRYNYSRDRNAAKMRKLNCVI